MKIVLHRHGETISNRERRLQGCQDIPLIDNGILQITRTAKHLVTTQSAPDLILASPLLRARHSAEIVAREFDYPTERILTEPLFIERGFGSVEGMTYEEALAQYPDSNYPGMETLDELLCRAQKAIDKCITDYQVPNLLVVAHGGIIKAVLVALTQGRIGYFDEKIWIENGSYCILENNENTWKITFHNASDDYSPLQLQ